MRKRIVSIVLALCMVLALMPQTAFAEGAGTSYILKEGTAGAGPGGRRRHPDRGQHLYGE